MLGKIKILLAILAVFLASGASQTTTYLFSNSNTLFANNIWNMSQSIAVPSTDLTTDVTVGKTASANFLIVTPGQTVTASVATLPAAIQLNGWRTNAPVTGEMATGNWTFSYKLQNRAARAHAGRMNMRVWMSINPNMSGATNLTDWVASPNILSFPATLNVILQDTVNITIPARNYTGEYIYVEFAWGITTAGSQAAAGFFFVSNEGVVNESMQTPDALNLNTPALVVTNPDIGKNNPADNATLACTVTCSPGACTNLNLRVEYNPGAGFTAIPTAATGGLQANAGTFSCGSVASCSNSWSVEGLSNATFPVRCAANATRPTNKVTNSTSQNIAVYAGLLTDGSFSPTSPFSVSIFDAVNLSGNITCTSPSVAKAGCGNVTLTARAGAVTANTQISGSTTPSLISGTTQQSCTNQFPVADGGSYSCPFSQITVNMTAGNGNGDTRFWDIFANSTDTQVSSLDPADQQIVGRVGNATVAVTSGAISSNVSGIFNISSTVTCASFRCVNVTAYARYNATTAVPDTPFSTTPNSVPAWLTANPLSCPTMNPGGTCTPQFNGTADNVTGTWLYDVLANATVVGVPSLNSSSNQLAVGRPLPDLNITNADIVLNNSNIYENDTVQINATFRNSGSAAATNVNVTYYINSTQQCSFIVPSMPVGATNKTTCLWTPSTQGNYTILVALDPANTIQESNKTNNNASANVTVNRRLPDLMMNSSSIALNATTIYENDIVQINATVFNVGNATAANVNVSYYINTTLQCSFTIPSLAVGASNTTSCNWNATTFGNYTITAAADPANTVAETNETNNNATRNVTVNLRRPDLMMNSSSLALNNTNIYENDVVQINATVFNIGNATATGVNITYYAINATNASTTLCSFIVPALTVGASNLTTCSWNATTFGNYTITAAADPANTVAETNETNNNATRNVTVNLRRPDLMMNASSLALNNTNPITGDIVQINATVFNIGNTTASSVNITYYAINATNATAALCSFIIPSLTVGASNTTTCNWNASTAGTFNITAAADPGNTIPETNETNNNASTSVSVGAATSLVIFDATDTVNIPPNTQITFYANYTTVPAGAPVTGATCAISIPFFNITANMTYNATSGLYQYNTSFAQSGTFTWNATCSRTGFQTKSANKSFTVTSFAFVVTDKASYSNCNRVYYRISLFNLTDSSADDALTVNIIDALGATRQSASNYTSGGAYSGAYAFTSPLVTGTWTIRANTTCVLKRQNFSAGEGNSDIWKIDVFFSPDQGGYASGTTITINSYAYNLHGVGVAGLGANVSANVDGGSVALTDNGLGRYTASYLTSASGAHYFEIRAITGSVNVTNRRGFFVR